MLYSTRSVSVPDRLLTRIKKEACLRRENHVMNKNAPSFEFVGRRKYLGYSINSSYFKKLGIFVFISFFRIYQKKLG